MHLRTSLPVISIALLAGAALAQTPPPATTTTHVQARTTTTAKSIDGAPPKVAETTRTSRTTTKATPGGRMVTAKTKTGKTITYDCAKPGNARKTACKQ